MKTTHTLIATATLLGAFALASPLLATAQTGPAAAAPAKAAAAQPTTAAPMSMARLVEHLATLGYREVREIERESDKLYEVKALNTQGQWTELVVDARSGEVLKEEFKHRREGKHGRP